MDVGKNVTKSKQRYNKQFATNYKNNNLKYYVRMRTYTKSKKNQILKNYLPDSQVIQIFFDLGITKVCLSPNNEDCHKKPVNQNTKQPCPNASIKKQS